MYLPLALAAIIAAGSISAHPGQDIKLELQERLAFLAEHTNSLDHCDSVHKAMGIKSRAIQRRRDLTHSVWKSRGLQARQGGSAVTKSHKSDKSYTPQTDPHLLFDSNKSVSQDVMGEAVRSKVVDDQKGVPLYLDFQVIDVNTCQPLKGVLVEMWNCNSTGVYSGALAIPNGSGMSDKSNLNKQFLRGIQKTNDDGVGRATHVHMATHLNATAEANNTVWHTTTTHAGQLFFDQALLAKVEKTVPYNTNMQKGLQNAADNILLAELPTADPFFDYVELGDDITHGVVAWYRLGINATFSRSIMAVAQNFKEGGKMITTNPKIPGLDQIFPGGFPTAYQPGFGGPAAAPTRPATTASRRP
ncbi:aromatic compound dioxygenase [Thozetella sp. PMI_491]|nr:aromatic compound dioxygenase [Thozetella sp. PMI_491]